MASQKVPFFDLHAQYKALASDIRAAIDPIFETSQYSGGSEVEKFEAEFAAYCGASEAIGVNSGTSALHLALHASGIGVGDEVITTPMTFVATVAAIEYAGAKPVLVDCEPRRLAIDPNLIAARITPRTKAIIPVHLHGRLADMDAINAIARKSNLLVIEDAAQAHGAATKGGKAGALGAIGCFSFYPSKNLGAYGEGGALTTSDAGFVRQARVMRSWGSEQRYVHKYKGFNYRMDGIQAAVLRVKLSRLDAWNQTRQAIAARYAARLRGLDLLLPDDSEPAAHVYHVYAVRSPRRDELQKWLNERGIGTSIHYPIPVHMQDAYRTPDAPPGAFPVCEKACRELLSLPLYPEMSMEQADVVADEVRRFFGASA